MAGISLKPLTKKYTLDFDGVSGVEIKQTTTGAIRRLAELFSDQTQIFDAARPTVSQIQRKWNFEDLKRERVFATLVGSDLTLEAEDDEKAEPVFNFRKGKNGQELASVSEFKEAWESLPPTLTKEIYECVVDFNEIWNPDKSGE